MNKIYSFLIALTFSTLSCTIHAANDTIRILCIGNSFSWDAVEQELAPLCHEGKQPIIILTLLKDSLSSIVNVICKFSIFKPPITGNKRAMIVKHSPFYFILNP